MIISQISSLRFLVWCVITTVTLTLIQTYELRFTQPKNLPERCRLVLQRMDMSPVFLEIGKGTTTAQLPHEDHHKKSPFDAKTWSWRSFWGVQGYHIILYVYWAKLRLLPRIEKSLLNHLIPGTLNSGAYGVPFDVLRANVNWSLDLTHRLNSPPTHHCQPGQSRTFSDIVLRRYQGHDWLSWVWLDGQ